MKAVHFPEENITYAKNQPEYLPLPTYKDDNGLVTSCYKVTLWEAIKLVFGARVWVTIKTFNNPLQPQRLHIGLYP